VTRRRSGSPRFARLAPAPTTSGRPRPAHGLARAGVGQGEGLAVVVARVLYGVPSLSGRAGCYALRRNRAVALQDLRGLRIL